jgi:hypothetical protein
MTAAAPVAGTVLIVVALVGAAVGSVHVAVRAPRPRTPSRRTAEAIPSRRIAAAAAVGFVVLLATRWVVLAVAAAVLTALWGRVLADRRAAEERARIDAIATWLEDLRDTLRGSSIGAEDALDLVAERPPNAIRAPLATFVARRRQGFRTEDALIDLADGLAHPTADAAVAALRLVVGGTAGAARLHQTVSALAAAARDEVRARERVDRTRAVYQSSMKRLVVITAVLVAYLRIAAGDLLDPYGTATGQVVLLLPIAMWVGCIVWLRSLCRDRT